jgi:hypothetical protein
LTVSAFSQHDSAPEDTLMSARTTAKLPKPSRPHMPGYGLPTGTKGLLPWTWAEQRLKKSHNYWISTARPDGTPHLMIVWGLWLNGAFYFSSGAQSRKAKNLAHNPHCVIGTEMAKEAVIVEGKANSVEGKEKSAIYKPYEKKYNFDMSEFKAEPIYRVRPIVAFGLAEKKSLKSATRWKFQ